MSSFPRTICALLLVALNAFATAQDTSVTISHQGPLFWALPLYISEQEGYFESQKIKPNFTVYSSGGPQVADKASWDIGAAGCVPNIIGGSQGILTVGISNDESAANVLVGSKAATFPPTEPITISMTGNSTAQYAVEACLSAKNVENVSFTYGSQSDVLDDLASTHEYGGLWAPNHYRFLESSEGSSVLCSGKSANAPVPGGIMVRKEYADQNPEVVHTVLAIWLRGINFIKTDANREKVLSYMAEYYLIYNVTVSKSALEQEIDTRPVYDLDQQIERVGPGGEALKWYENIALFLLRKGVLESVPLSTFYITPDYMIGVKDNSCLKDFANGGESTAPCATSTSSATLGLKWSTLHVSVACSLALISGAVALI